MTTREELIDGLRMTIREGLRTMRSFGPDDWKAQVHSEEGGWNVKQIYCHLAAIADIVPAFVGLLAQAKHDEDAGGTLDVNDFNAQGVATREGMSEPELMEAFKTSHEKVIEFVQGMPEEQLQQEGRFGTLEGTVADIMATGVVLHGLSHIYHAVNRV